MIVKVSICLSSLVFFTSCDQGTDPGVAHPAGTHTHADGTVHRDEPAAPDGGHSHAHGDRHPLGKIEVGGYSIDVFQITDIVPGKEGDFDLDFPTGRALPAAVRGWIGVESSLGSMKVRFEKEAESRMHGHPEVPEPIPAGSQLWIEIESSDGTARSSVAFNH